MSGIFGISLCQSSNKMFDPSTASGPPAKQKQTEAIEHSSLYCTSTVQFLVVCKFTERLKDFTKLP